MVTNGNFPQYYGYHLLPLLPYFGKSNSRCIIPSELVTYIASQKENDLAGVCISFLFLLLLIALLIINFKPFRYQETLHRACQVGTVTKFKLAEEQQAAMEKTEREQKKRDMQNVRALRAQQRSGTGSHRVVAVGDGDIVADYDENSRRENRTTIVNATTVYDIADTTMAEASAGVVEEAMLRPLLAGENTSSTASWRRRQQLIDGRDLIKPTDTSVLLPLCFPY